MARLKGSAFYNDEGIIYPAVGDFVLIRFNQQGDSIIYTVLPRRAYFSRLDPPTRQTEQIVATNFDYVFIMLSLNHNFSIGRIERYRSNVDFMIAVMEMNRVVLLEKHLRVKY